MSVDSSHPAARFLADMFADSTSAPVYICSLPNHEDQSPIGERHVATCELQLIEQFVKKWDRPQRGLYFCVSTVKLGSSTRSRETVAELNGLHVDIDFRSVDGTPQDVEQTLRQVQLLPSKVVRSGGGLHAYWLFKEALQATTENIRIVEMLLGLLADHLGGDPNVCHVASLMRLPGTHNTKQGAWTEVTLVADRPLRYELDELEDWLTIVSPVIRRRRPVKETHGPDQELNPWLAVAERLGFKPPIDVEQRLAAMRYQGAADNGVHATQISVSAALLCRGEPVEEVVATVIEATRAAAGPFGERWNWHREERAVRRTCEDWLAKHPELVPGPRYREKEQDNSGDNEQGRAAQAGLSPARENGRLSLGPKTADGKQRHLRHQAKRRNNSDNSPIIIADGVIETVRQSGGDLVLTGSQLYFYRHGVWSPISSVEEKWLKVLIQQGGVALGVGAKLATLNAAWKRLVEHPSLYKENIEWDRGGLVAVANGVLNVCTREFSNWNPDYFLQRKLNVAFDQRWQAPRFVEFLSSLFADRSKEERQSVISLLQEFFGASLAMDLLSREQRRALLIIGASRTGKTVLAELIRRLVGEPIAAPAVADVGERFGLAAFHGTRAWIRDDAINEGDKLNPQRFKVVVTGEAMDVEKKNQDAFTTRLNIPVVLTANPLPNVRDASDAIFNRCLVVELFCVLSEEEAVEARRRAGIPQEMTFDAWLFDQEGPGILNWALEGLDRLLVRGRFEIPDPIRASIQRFKDDTNPVAEWARTMLEKSPVTSVERGDLLCAFHGWWRQEMGDDVRLLGGRWLFPKLRTSCPWVEDIKTNGSRFVVGIKLNQEGLKFWKQQNEDAMHGARGKRGVAASVDFVNRSWDVKVADDEKEVPPKASEAPRF